MRQAEIVGIVAGKSSGKGRLKKVVVGEGDGGGGAELLEKRTCRRQVVSRRSVEEGWCCYGCLRTCRS